MASAYPSPAPSPAPSRRGSNTRPRVAVVGSGLAGLTAAYLLRKEGADVWLVEKATQLGFHAWSVELEQDGKLATNMSAGEAGAWKETGCQFEGYTVPDGSPTRYLRPYSPVSTPVRRRTSSSSTSSSHIPSRPSSPVSASPFNTASVPSPLDTASVSAAFPSAPSTPDGIRKRKTSASLRSDTIAIDVPMRSFQGGYYPLLIALYAHLRLPIAPAHFSFSFSALRPRRKTVTKEDTYFIHSGASGVSLPNVPGNAWENPISLIRAVLALLLAGVCYVILLATSLLSWHGLLPARLSGDATFRTVIDGVAEFVDRPVAQLPSTRLGLAFREFAADIVLPLFSSVGTMTAEDVWSTPAVHIFDYIHAGVGTAHYSLGGGRSARDVARALAAPIRKQGDDRVRLGSAIHSIKYNTKYGTAGVTVSLDGGADIDVDYVIIATPARAARHLLGTFEPSLAVHGEKVEARRVARMRTALAEVTYRDAIVTTHRDDVVLPPSADVRDINLIQPVVSEPYAEKRYPLAVDVAAETPITPSPASSMPVHQLSEAPFFPPTEQALYTMATHVITPPNGIAPVYQTTNPVVPIDPDCILGVARLPRALPLRSARTLSGLHPQSTHRPLVYLVGSYAYPGIPLLEGCVGSARRAVEDICQLSPAAATGGVDWEAGRGSWLGRVWRWRAEGRGGYY